MKYEANIYQMIVDGHCFWIAESKSLKGCVGQGKTSEEAIQELEENEIEWIKTAKDYGISIPPVSYRRETSYSGKLSLRMSPLLHEHASEISTLLGISLNQYISDAVGFYNSEAMRRLKESSSTVDKEELVTSNIITFSNFNNNETSYPNVDIIDNLEEM